jgi:hypothetical protein
MSTAEEMRDELDTDENGVKKEGSWYVSQNGYHYTKKDGKFHLTHRLIMEQKLGRKLEKGERVKFKDNDRTNLDPDNIVMTNPQQKSLRAQLAVLIAKRDDLQAQIDDIEHQLNADRSIADELEQIPVLPQAQGAYQPKDYRNTPGEQRAKAQRTKR